MAELSDIVTLTTISSTRANLWQDRLVQRYSSVANRTTEHPTPAEGDLSYLEDSNTVQVFNGSAWVNVAAPVQTGDIADSAVTSAKIADGTIATGDMADSAVTSAKIADGTIVAGDLAGSVAQDLFRGGGGMDVTTRALTASFVDQSSVSFTKPASWTTYRITAWGFALIVGAGLGVSRIELGGSNGAATPALSSPYPQGCFHTADTSTSPLTVAIACQQTVASANHHHSYVAYLAFRLT